jgi:predicted PurR-regulated permease PerM
LSLIIFMSIDMALDSERIRRGIRSLVPARYHPQLDVVDAAVSRAFGGFVRGQVVLGLIYGGVALVACLVLDLPYVPLIAITVAVLQMIPNFGPYVSWLPPVIDALVYRPDDTLPALVIMIIGMLVLANVLQPRIIGEAVGLNPLAVLVVVLIGAKVAGVLGAVFAVPVAAAAVTIVQRLWRDDPLVAATPSTATDTPP